VLAGRRPAVGLGLLATIAAVAVLVTTVASAGASPTRRAASSAVTAGSASSLTIARPAGVQAGDVLVAGVTTRLSPTGAITAPAGWSLVRRDVAAGGANLLQAAFVRVTGAAEPGAYTWAFSSSTGAAGTIVAYGGIDTASPVVGAAGSITSSTNRMVAPSTTSVTDGVAVGLFGNNGTRATTAPSGMSELGDVQVGGPSGAALETAELSGLTDGGTGDRVAVSDDPSNSSNAGQIVVLRPAGGPVTATTTTTTTGGTSTVAPPPATALGTAVPAALPASSGPVVSVSTSAGLQAALTAAVAGQQIVLAAGTYGSGATRWSLDRSGTAAAPITIAAAPGATVTIRGRLKTTGSYLRLVGLRFIGPNDEVNLWIAGGTAVELIASEVAWANWHAGLYVSTGGSFRVERSWLHDNGRFATASAPEGGMTYNLDHNIYVSSSASGVIANNLIERARGFGIQLYTAARNLVITGNTIVRSGNAGIVVDGSGNAGNRITGNVVALSNRFAGNGSIQVGSGSVGSGNVITRNVLDRAIDLRVGGVTVSGNAVGDPRIGSDYRLLDGSPAIGMAEPSYAVSPDRDGRSRDGAPDAGGYER
jgi:parallel beta-helix repeat protein